MRWISGIILAIGLAALLMYAPVLYIKAVVVALAVLGAWEFFAMAYKDESRLSRVLPVCLCALGTALLALSSNISGIFYFFYVVIFSSLILQFTKNVEPDVKVNRAAFFVLGVIYISVLFGLFGKILDHPRYQFWLFLVFAVTFLSDTFAYVVGKNFGKKKMAPKLSPEKTVEGTLAGLVAGMLAAFVIRSIFWPEFELLTTLVLGLIVAVFGVLGDLSESLLKRGFGVKDSGKIIPGHGGILDRLDALLFTAPLIYFISMYF